MPLSLVPEVPQTQLLPQDPSYRDLPAYYRILPGGRILDTRYCYGRGDRVKITSGTFKGRVGTVVVFICNNCNNEGEK